MMIKRFIVAAFAVVAFAACQPTEPPGPVAPVTPETPSTWPAHPDVQPWPVDPNRICVPWQHDGSNQFCP